jgi:hypothetical protein
VFRGLFVAVVLALAMTVYASAPMLAADPVASPTAVASPLLVDPLDPRAGEGASTVGAPFLAVLAVVGIGLLAGAATYVVVRVTQRT